MLNTVEDNEAIQVKYTMSTFRFIGRLNAVKVGQLARGQMKGAYIGHVFPVATCSDVLDVSKDSPPLWR